MNLLAELDFDMVYTLFLGNNDKARTYHCSNCGHSFAEYGNTFDSSSRRYCPRCGYVHEYFSRKVEPNVLYPLSANFTLKETTNKVYMTCVFKTGMIENRDIAHGDVFADNYGYRRETITVDVKSRRTTWKVEKLNRYKADPQVVKNQEVGDYLSLELKNSMLLYMSKYSYAYSRHTKAVTAFLRKFREFAQRKIEKRIKRKLGYSLFENPSSDPFGVVLPLIRSVAWANAFPDINPLSIFNYDFKVKPKESWDHFNMSHYNSEWYEKALASKKKSAVQAWIDAAGLPDTAAIRKVLSSRFISLASLSVAFRMFKNHDNAMRFFNSMKCDSSTDYTNGYRYYWESHFRQIDQTDLDFAKEIVAHFDEKKLLAAITSVSAQVWKDMITMYNQCADETKERFYAEKPKPKEMHDWLAKLFNKQTDQNVSLNIPEELTELLTKSVAGLDFSVPQMSGELAEIGIDLHNCVKGYSRSVIAGYDVIVLAKVDGMPFVCIQVSRDNKAIVQAKLTCNDPVSTKPAVNAALVQWAKECKLAIDTRDIDEESAKDAA